MYACNGILFNHESPLRGETFVTRKVTRAAAKIALGLQDALYMGNLDAQRDWGHAKDYVEAMYLILQQETPEDYVVATGVTTRVRDFIRKTFAFLGITLDFTGENENETGIISAVDTARFDELGIALGNHLALGTVVVKIDPRYYRPTEVELLIGDPTKAKEKLGWTPKHTLDMLIADMAMSDLRLFQKDKLLLEEGFNILNYYE